MFVNFLLPITAAVTLAHLVIAQGTDIEPARIYGSTSRVTIGQDFDLRCSTYGLTKADERVFVYLCKNGVGLQRATTTSHDIPFTIKSATLNHTGNYSCVFSRNKHTPAEVNVEGDMPVFIKVIAFLVAQMTMLNAGAVTHPALISASTTSVKEGDSVTLKCSISDAKISEYPQNMYLCKDGVGIRMQILMQENVPSFALDNFTSMDSGKYSCVHSTKKVPPKDVHSTGKNSVVIKLHDSGFHAIHPATISEENTVLTEGGILQLQCQITEREYHDHLVFHLSKNGVGIPVTPERNNNNSHAVFMIRNITTKDSGNYSCVFVDEYTPMEVRGEGVNSIHIKVLSAEDLNADCELCHPAHISRHKTTVLKGDPLQITCSIENPEPGQFHMYLCKDGLGIQMFPATDGVNFTVEKPVSGHYSCVYSPAKMVTPQCRSSPAAVSVFHKVVDPDVSQESSGSESSAGLAAMTVIFLLVLAALLGYQQRDRLRRLIWSDRGRQRQGGTQGHMPAGGTEQQHQSMATYEEIAGYASISDLQGQNTAAAVSSTIDTVYSMVQNQDQVAEDPTYCKVNKKGKTKKPKGVTDVYALVGHP
ncbi:uncharacterized protein LOC143132250 [Alosa pseudoharengus]|uniref:uncharacterized protein LOC143132250 n=1 Tax=Alosa pseudoharengus TaxID=34774 RepID=UPI003F88EF3B